MQKLPAKTSPVRGPSSFAPEQKQKAYSPGDYPHIMPVMGGSLTCGSDDLGVVFPYVVDAAAECQEVEGVAVDNNYVRDLSGFEGA